MIELIFTFESTRARQRAAPLFKEREQFLSFLLQQGTSIARLRTLALMLLHVVRLMRLKKMQMVESTEIEEGARLYVADLDSSCKNGQRKSTSLFIYTAIAWLKFHDKFRNSASRIEPDDTHIDRFVHFMTDVRRMSAGTVVASRLRVKAFLKWTSNEGRPLSATTLQHIDQYISFRVNNGYLPRSIAGVCSALKLFFGFAESEKWVSCRIAGGIDRPKIPRYDSGPKGPAWSEVRRLLDCPLRTNAADVRAWAILSLCAIYAMRSSEVVRLKLSDIDWRNDILTVKRAKSGRIQKFPLQAEVGERIIDYLQSVRPSCTSRNLFVTLRPPYRPVHATAIWVVVASRLKRLGIESKTFGGHALRHACATQLLQLGTSLPDIADFLVHRDLKSVSMYAKHDIAALRQVAEFSMAGVYEAL